MISTEVGISKEEEIEDSETREALTMVREKAGLMSLEETTVERIKRTTGLPDRTTITEVTTEVPATITDLEKTDRTEATKKVTEDQEMKMVRVNRDLETIEMREKVIETTIEVLVTIVMMEKVDLKDRIDQKGTIELKEMRDRREMRDLIVVTDTRDLLDKTELKETIDQNGQTGLSDLIVPDMTTDKKGKNDLPGITTKAEIEAVTETTTRMKTNLKAQPAEQATLEIKAFVFKSLM